MKEPSTALIAIGVLKGYVKNPIGFMIRTKLTFAKFKKSIEMDLPNDFIDTTGLVAWIYIRLSKKVGKEKAFEIIRATVLTSGLAIQQAQFKNVDAPRTFKNITKNITHNNNEGTTRLNTMEVIEQSDKKFEFRITRCLFFEFFTHVNVPELTSIMCSIDNAIFNSYLPERITFHRNGIDNNFVGGHEYCEFVLENNEVQHKA